jgi:hypothetical protein
MKRWYLIVWVSCVSACSQNTLESKQQFYPVSESQILVAAAKPHLQIQQKKELPTSFQVWESHAINHQAIQHYKKFLKQQGLVAYVPNFEFFQTARDWQKCNAAEFEVPPQELWPNIVPTLKILDLLIDQRILNDFTVTSVYRNLNLNKCANGASSSKHIFNAALDFRVGSEAPDSKEQITIQNTKLQLCRFWHDQGEQLNMGLGIYPSGQIHIDSAGYRTWGADHRYRSSLCMHTFFNTDKKLDQ